MVLAVFALILLVLAMGGPMGEGSTVVPAPRSPHVGPSPLELVSGSVEARPEATHVPTPGSGSLSSTSSPPDCESLTDWPSTLAFNFNLSALPLGGQTSCVLASNFTIGVGGELSVWYPSDMFTDPSHTGGNGSWETLFVEAGGTLVIGNTQTLSGGAYVQAFNHTSLRLVVLGTLEIIGGAGLWLSNTSTLVLGPQGSIVLRGGALYTPPGSSVVLAGGNVVMRQGGSWSGAPPPTTSSSSAHSQWGYFKAGGVAGNLEDNGTPVANLTLSEVGNLTVESTAVTRLNITGAASTVSFEGFFAQPELVANVTVQQVGTFKADQAELQVVHVNSAGTVELGNATSTADHVGVDGFTIESSVGNLSLTHASVEDLLVSKALRVSVVNSTFVASDSVTQALDSFSATGNSRFAFPLVFNNAPRVNLTNISATSLEVADYANVTVNNWPTPTSLTGASSGTLSTIMVSQSSVVVHVNRYLLVRAVLSSGGPTPPGTTVTVCSALTSLPCTSAAVSDQGYLGLFVPTDVVSLSGLDQFVGTYQVSVSAPGYATAQTTVQVTSDDTNATLTLTAPVVPLGLVPVLALELGSLALVVGAILYFRRQTRRIRRPRTTGKREDGTPAAEEGEEEPPEEEGSGRAPAKEWKAPGSKGTKNGAGPSTDRDVQKEGRRGADQ
jgi:hypothetical protein